MFVGVLLLLMGVLLILEKMDIIYGDFGDFIWPVALVALGIHLISDHRRKSR